MQKWRNESFVDVVNLILGAWLFLTPWAFGFAGGEAGWNAWIFGVLIAVVAIAALLAFAEWEEWNLPRRRDLTSSAGVRGSPLR
jgi:SPW repeat